MPDLTITLSENAWAGFLSNASGDEKTAVQVVQDTSEQRGLVLFALVDAATDAKLLKGVKADETLKAAALAKAEQVIAAEANKVQPSPGVIVR